MQFSHLFLVLGLTLAVVANPVTHPASKGASTQQQNSQAMVGACDSSDNDDDAENDNDDDNDNGNDTSKGDHSTTKAASAVPTVSATKAAHSSASSASSGGSGGSGNSGGSGGSGNSGNSGNSGDTGNTGGNSTSSGGKTMQATVTGYSDCLTQGMACGLTGSPGKDPTAAMSGYLIPTYGKGKCGSCWKLSNPRGLNYNSNKQVPTVGGPLKNSKGDGMVVLINNSCAPGKDQYQAGAVGQCAQTDANPTDKLGSQTVLDLCRDTNAVEMMFGSPNPGMAVADLEEVDCSEWSGTVKKAS